VTHEETGLLVPSRQVEPLAAAMLRLARRPDERRRLGAAGREAVRRRFDADRLVADIASMYHAGLDSKRGRRTASADTIAG
jgi:glycosyltransferase involved in cell wall biosynthesis